MSSFTDKLIVTPTDDGDEWIIERPFSYYVGDKSDYDIIDIHKGFITDFASIPRILWTILPPFGRYSQAAVVHDLLCKKRTRSSKETHKIFNDAMKVLKVSKWKRTIMYFGVRCCGPKW